jgi:hypothetical protein
MKETLSAPRFSIILFALSSLMSRITTFAPAATKFSTVACPKPDAPPVTKATLF